MMMMMVMLCIRSTYTGLYRANSPIVQASRGHMDGWWMDDNGFYSQWMDGWRLHLIVVVTFNGRAIDHSERPTTFHIVQNTLPRSHGKVGPGRQVSSRAGVRK